MKINIDLAVLPSHDIAAHLSAQNSIVKCLNHTLIKYVYAIMLKHNISYFFWPEAVAYTYYLTNRSPI